MVGLMPEGFTAGACRIGCGVDIAVWLRVPPAIKSRQLEDGIAAQHAPLCCGKGLGPFGNDSLDLRKPKALQHSTSGWSEGDERSMLSRHEKPCKATRMQPTGLTGCRLGKNMVVVSSLHTIAGTYQQTDEAMMEVLATQHVFAF